MWRSSHWLLVLSLLAAACSPKLSYQVMAQQPRYEPYEPSTFFENGTSARPLVEGVVPRGGAREDTLLYTGMVNGQPSGEFPFPVTEAVMARGQERYTIFCTPCHGAVGDGQGIVVQRGFTPPPSFHIERLRTAPPGYFFDVVTHGFGAMPSYADQVPARDRWAIIAYIRALQLSQHATLDDVPPEERGNMQPGGEP